MLYIKNDVLEIQFDSNNGAIRKIIDGKHGITILQNDLDTAFQLELEEEEYTDAFDSFTYEQGFSELTLHWKINNEIELVADWQLKDNTLRTSSYVINQSIRSTSSVEYPILDGIEDLKKLYGMGEGCNNYVAHSYATGFLIENPMEHFKEGEGFRYMPYPESFSGASMQFFTYYCNQRAGLYFAAYDNEYHQKWLNFYKYHGKLRASQIYGYEDIGAGKGLSAPWSFVITLTKGDDWYEACDIYKYWALKQPWCSGRKLEELSKEQKADWLFEDMGACTFGINGCHDRTTWLERYSKDIKTPIFHVLGPDWAKEEQNYYNSLPGGYGDWVPTRFNQENIRTIQKNKDKFAPFEFDFLVAIDKSDSDLICSSLQKWPKKPKSKDEYKFTMLCPICSYTKELHVKRDVQVLKESNLDAMYYDISANNILKTCMSDEHGHPVGAGKAMTEAYRAIYKETREQLSKEKGRYVPLGTEMMNEVFIDCLDYYQARANAQPCSCLETWIFRDLVREGKATLIPMFQYVYSGYTPLRMDGWGKLTKEGGDLIYHTIAKTYLWGGLFEINSEYSEMEAIDGKVNSSSEHYCRFKHYGYEYDTALVEYIAKYASLRTGRYNKYLAYGEMKRPPHIDGSQIWRTYFHYNISKHSKEYGDRDTILLDSLIIVRYAHQESELILLANTTDFNQEITWGDDFLKDDESYQVVLDYVNDESPRIEMSGGDIRKHKLLPKQLLVIEKI